MSAIPTFNGVDTLELPVRNVCHTPALFFSLTKLRPRKRNEVAQSHIENW